MKVRTRHLTKTLKEQLPVSEQVHMRSDAPLPLYAPALILYHSLPSLQLHTYLMDGLFLNKKINNIIRVSYSLKYKHSKKEYNLYEKIK